MLAPSVAGVATAVPAFIGFTEKPAKKGIQPITSLLEYETIFGEGQKLTVEKKGNDLKLKGYEYALYDSMRLFYDNGGGNCYVVSIGTYGTTATADLYNKAIALLEEQSDVTIVAFPDAAMLLDAAGLASVQMQALKHCAAVGGRFTILDLKRNDPKDTDTPTSLLKDELKQFRDGVTDALCYGAAYYPYLKSSYSKDIDFAQVIAAMPEVKAEDKEVLYTKATAKAKNEETGAKAGDENYVKEGDVAKEAGTEYAKVMAKAAEIIALPDDDPKKQLRINAMIPQIEGYAEKLAELQDIASVIPPSGAIAGIYASTDSRVGVWQAPANVGIASVKDLTQQITDAQQDEMNVDPETAKSVNAIRYFKGKGILVWGSRTLDGGSNEWRYVPVRRLFTYVEQSVKLSTSWAVFQPNDENTWVKIKCQVSNFLSNLWNSGALTGATPDDAYFVEVGKGITMTEDDINNGYLRVRIGLAAVRPAEFIVLEFSHKVQE